MTWYTRDGEPLADEAALANANDWAKERRVAITDLGGLRVSTVFLGVDHWDPARDEPMLFETMVFGGDPVDNIVARYASEEEALRGHLSVLDEIRAGQPVDPADVVERLVDGALKDLRPSGGQGAT